MIKTFTSFLYLFFAIQLVLFGQAEKILVQSFPLNGAVKLDFSTLQPASVEKWNNDFVRIIVEIRLKQGNADNLKRLLMAGKFKVQGDYSDNSLKLSTQKSVPENPNEEVIYKISVPAALDLSANTTKLGTL